MAATYYSFSSLSVPAVTLWPEGGRQRLSLMAGTCYSFTEDQSCGSLPLNLTAKL